MSSCRLGENPDELGKVTDNYFFTISGLNMGAEPLLFPVTPHLVPQLITNLELLYRSAWPPILYYLLFFLPESILPYIKLWLRNFVWCRKLSDGFHSGIRYSSFPCPLRPARRGRPWCLQLLSANFYCRSITLRAVDKNNSISVLLQPELQKTLMLTIITPE